MLNEQQIRRLDLLFLKFWRTSSFPLPGPNQLEPAYTSTIILPRIQTFLSGLKNDNLFIRGDGGVAPLPLVVDGLSFYPDLEVVEHHQRYLAVEVKFLRPGIDPTGSITKALGQGLVYRSLGIGSAHVVLFDLRVSDQSPSEEAVSQWLEKLNSSDISLHWYVPRNGELVIRRELLGRSDLDPSYQSHPSSVG